ncbi:MAG: hypothetical protein FJ288_15515, partial [Planctomycetes bacterium]|nr:hypothetical protein [Planctomycetota bacterium]
MKRRRQPLIENLEPRVFLAGGGLAAPALADQVMPHTQDLLVLALPETDGEGTPLAYTAAARSPAAEAYALRTSLGLSRYVSQYDNYSGRGERWFQDARAGWHYLLPDGRLYRWGSGALEGAVDAAYWADPLGFLAAQAGGAPAVALDVAGSRLIIDPDAAFAGRFLVDLTVANGAAQATASFSVTVVNAAPILDIADQTMPHTQDVLLLDLPATDADGDVITYAASVLTGDAAAYELKTRLGLASYAAQYDNWLGRREKWFQDAR